MQNLNPNTLLKRNNYHRPLNFNGVLWLLIFTILLFVFSKGQFPIAIDIVYTLAFVLLLLVIPILTNLYIFIPRFLKKEKYFEYGLTFIFSLEVFAYYGSKVFKPVLDWLFPNYFFISYPSREAILLIVVLILIITTLLKLAEDWFYFNTKENKNLRLRNQHIQTQLLSLRSQINPHFLFNSLNVIYSLALEKKEDITKAIVQLSDILRYVIYDSNTPHVTLKDEIQLLKNYIAFQNHRMKISNDTNFNIAISDENFEIYPMLLLPLLENSYKHGIISGEPQKPISIEMKQQGNVFNFIIINANLNTKNQIKDEDNGIGLENLRNNLNLVYPNRHQFKIEVSKELFKVELQILNED